MPQHLAVLDGLIAATILEREPPEHFAFAQSFRRLCACSVPSNGDI